MAESITIENPLKRKRTDEDEAVSNKKNKNGRLGIGTLAPQKKGQESFEAIMGNIRKKQKANSSETFQSQKENHIKLMCAQIKNQLPGDEVDHDKFMQTFFQMMNTEQILQMNERLFEANNLQKILARAEQLKYIKKEVGVESSYLQFNGSPIETSYTLPEKVSHPTLELFHSSNSKVPVLSIPLDPDALSGSVVLNGMIDENTTMPTGDYFIKAHGQSTSEKTEDGLVKTVQGSTNIYLPIDSIDVDKENDKTYFVSGNMAFSEQDIRSIKKAKGIEHYNALKPKTVATESQTDPLEQDIVFNPSSTHEQYVNQSINDIA